LLSATESKAGKLSWENYHETHGPSAIIRKRWEAA
jgi:hypothetical protein